MKKPPSRPEPRTMVSLRVAPALLKAVHEYVLDYNTSHGSGRPGFSIGEPDVITDSVALRRALGAGLKVLREELDAYQKAGQR